MLYEMLMRASKAGELTNYWVMLLVNPIILCLKKICLQSKFQILLNIFLNGACAITCIGKFIYWMHELWHHDEQYFSFFQAVFNFTAYLVAHENSNV